MTTTFQQAKQLRVTFTVATPGATFPGTGKNVLMVAGLRMSAVTEGTARYANKLNLSIYGMAKTDMDALTVLKFGPKPTTIGDNTLLLEANDGSGWNKVFTGTITNATPQYSRMPNVSFEVEVVVGYFAGAAAVAPRSYEGGADAADVMQSIATSMKLQFQNNGVQVLLPAGSYFEGSNWDQLKAIVDAADFDYYIDNNTLIICNKYQPMNNIQLVELSPTNGLIDYPRIGVSGIEFDCYYTPAIALAGRVRISGSDVPAANNGEWVPYSVSHQLDANLPGGKWQSTLNCIWHAAT